MFKQQKLMALALCLIISYVSIYSTAYGRTEFTLQNAKDWESWYEYVLPLALEGELIYKTEMGWMYLHGNGVEQCYIQAEYWYRLAAEQGEPVSQTVLGLFYSGDLGAGIFELNFEMAAYWYRKAAERGWAQGQNNLARLYERGYGVEQDYRQAAYWYRKAAGQGYAIAQNNLGNAYRMGRGVEQCYKQAAYLYRLAAEQGLAIAQTSLGYMYRVGEGVEQDYLQAYKWTAYAALQGHLTAMFGLASFYDRAEGVEQDYERAEYWYRLAAEQGHGPAQNNLGILYEYGRWLPENHEKAVYWYRLAAEQGLSIAQSNMGRMYRLGRGTEQDYQESLYWVRLAAEQNFPRAIRDLGRMYYWGLGLEENTEQAIYYFHRAAELADGVAIRYLILLYGQSYIDALPMIDDFTSWGENAADFFDIDWEAAYQAADILDSLASEGAEYKDLGLLLVQDLILLLSGSAYNVQFEDLWEQVMYRWEDWQNVPVLQSTGQSEKSDEGFSLKVDWNEAANSRYWLDRMVSDGLSHKTIALIMAGGLLEHLDDREISSAFADLWEHILQDNWYVAHPLAYIRR